MSRLKITLCNIFNDRDNPFVMRILQPTVIILAILNIASLVVYSYDPSKFINRFMYSITYYSGVIFTIEYIIRCWVATIQPSGEKNRWGRIKYIFSFFGIIDLISILPFILPLILTEKHELVEVINFTRIFIVLKIIRYSQAFQLLRDVLHSSRQELIMVVSIGATIVTFAGLLMYYIERGAQPEVFNNVGSGFWWAIITFATVGYGDIYPITDLGKLLASIMAIVGIGMIAMPTAIISSALMTKMDERKSKNMAELTARQIADELKKQEDEQDDKRQHEEDAEYCSHCGARISKNQKEDPKRPLL